MIKQKLWIDHTGSLCCTLASYTIFPQTVSKTSQNQQMKNELFDFWDFNSFIMSTHFVSKFINTSLCITWHPVAFFDVCDGVCSFGMAMNFAVGKLMFELHTAFISNMTKFCLHCSWFSALERFFGLVDPFTLKSCDKHYIKFFTITTTLCSSLAFVIKFNCWISFCFFIFITLKFKINDKYTRRPHW